MSGYPHLSLLADEAILAASIDQYSTMARVRAPRLRPRQSATAMHVASSSSLSLHDTMWSVPRYEELRSPETVLSERHQTWTPALAV